MNDIKYYLLLILFFISLSVYDISHNASSVKSCSIEDIFTKVKIREKIEENERFIFNLACRESSNDPDTVNSIGAIGLFQFMPTTLLHLGYNIPIEDFKENPYIFPANMQLEALNKKIQLDVNTLTKQWFRSDSANIDYIKTYVGSKIKGVEITLSGILAACHLAGSGGVINYFDNYVSPKDLYGTSLEDYLLKFSKYDYHTLTQAEKKLCIKQREDGILGLPLSLKQLKLQYVEEVSRDMETQSTLYCQGQLGLSNRLILYTRLDLELKYSCRNTTEQLCTLEAAPLQNVDYPYQMDLVKWSGIIVKSGIYWHNPILCMSRKLGIDYANSILSRSGMLHGIPKFLICSSNFGFRRLKSFPHLGVG